MSNNQSNSQGNKDHPVWGVYDLYRTARLNVKYYSTLLHKVELLNFYFDIVLLISAPRKLTGIYWTDRKSTGEIIMEFHDKNILDEIPDELNDHPMSQ